MAKRRPNTRQKEIVKQRAYDCCEYCCSQEAYSPDTFSVEHIIPLAKGGSNDTDNLAHACQGCNNRKFTSTEAIDPLTGTVVPLYHPRLDRWTVHFAWNESGTSIIGLTPTGRATIEKLELNRSGVINLRRLLAERGLHPIFPIT